MGEMSLWLRYLASRGLLVMLALIYICFFVVIHPNPIFYVDLNKLLLLPYDIYEMGFLIKLVVYLILIFLTTTFLELLIILIISGVKSVNENVNDRVKKTLSRSLYDHISHERSKKADKLFVKRLESLLATEYSWRVLIDLLCRINQISTGATHQQSRKLFFRIKAEVFVRKYLRSPFRSHRLFALKAIAAFRLSGFMFDVKAYLNSTNYVMRHQALISWLRIAPFDDLQFLCNPDKLFSIREMDVALKEVNKFKKINYNSLLDAPHPAVQLLGLRLVMVHQKREYKSKIIDMLNSEHELLREESRICLSSMLSTAQDVELMMDGFDSLSWHTRQHLVETVMDMEASTHKSDFLHWIIEEKNYDLKLLVFRYLIGVDFMQLHTYKNHASELVRKAYQDIIILTR